MMTLMDAANVIDEQMIITPCGRIARGRRTRRGAAPNRRGLRNDVAPTDRPQRREVPTAQGDRARVRYRSAS